MRAFAKSDVGKTRDINQDYYYISTPDKKVKLYIVADGMGGCNGGEVASKLATISTKRYIESNFDKIKYDREEILNLIKNAVEYANMVVYEKSKEDKQYEGMGTTLDACLVYNNKVYIGHVGDSRVYRVRKEIIRKLTTDHSYVEQLIQDGKITRNEAETHPKKNLLVKALGCTPFVEADVMVRGFVKDDVIVMNSDGLTNMIKEDEIYKTVKENPKRAAYKLVEKANKNGGYDNITVVTVIHD